MLQTLLVWALFLAAAGYLGRLVYRAFQPAKSGCSEGECKCSTEKTVKSV